MLALYTMVGHTGDAKRCLLHSKHVSLLRLCTRMMLSLSLTQALTNKVRFFHIDLLPNLSYLPWKEVKTLLQSRKALAFFETSLHETGAVQGYQKHIRGMPARRHIQQLYKSAMSLGVGQKSSWEKSS